MRKIFVAVAAMAMLPTSAQAAEIINGSFEQGGVTNPFGTVTGGNNSTITGWTVLGNSVDFIGNYWQAAQGTNSIDLNGSGQGGIAQTFNTVANQAYAITFFLAGNPDNGPTIKTINVTTNNANAQVFSFDTTGLNKSNMGWKQFTYNFVGTGSPTTLAFNSQTSGSWGAVLDNVSISAVPEPATWAMMLLGIGLIGGAMRSRIGVGFSKRTVVA
jgi:choice-of-anchor C domain-containing protein